MFRLICRWIAWWVRSLGGFDARLRDGMWERYAIVWKGEVID